MELTPIKDILTKSQKDFIHNKAYNYAKQESEDQEEMELLYSKYFFQFMQETVLKSL